MDEAIVKNVLTKISQMRNQLNVEEQSVLDKIITKAADEDEVSAHSMSTAITPRWDLSVSFNVAKGEYEVITK